MRCGAVYEGPIHRRPARHAVITAAEPGQEFAFTTPHKKGREETVWRYRFRQLGASTEVTESYQFLWCPIANRIAELPVPRDKQLHRGIHETLNRIKAAAEQVRN